jgi:hypothetical protein
MLSISAAIAIIVAPVLATRSSVLNFSSSAPYIFSSVSGLLEQWSNTFFPNGHTISACEIPKHTLFYHGRIDTSDPPSPEWLAFDIEMSYGIMGNDVDSRILTYRTTRAVQCIYFDGTSASLMGSGTEAQMTFLYGNSESVPSRPGPGRGRRPPRKDYRGDRLPHNGLPDDVPPGRSNSIDGFPRWNPLADEYFRARGLCKWIKERGLGGLGWGYEGIIRMNAGFEMIWCNFTSPSLQLVSNLNVSVPRLQGGQDQKDPRRHLRDFPLAPRSSSPQQVPLGMWTDEVLPEDEGPHGPGMTDPSEPFRGAANWMWFAAAARRYGSSSMGASRGEARAKVRTCGLFTFYDQDLSGQNSARIQEEQIYLNLTSSGQWKGQQLESRRKLALDQLMRRRRWHRTNHVSKEDGVLMRESVEKSLLNALNQTGCSDIDWHLIAQEIVTAYAQNLQDLSRLVSDPPKTDRETGTAARSWLASVRIITHWFMFPFFEYPPRPYTNDSLLQDFSLNSPAAQTALKRCQSQYNVLEGEVLSESEGKISRAIEETLTAICHSVFEVGLSIEILWLSKFNAVSTESSEQHHVKAKVSAWKEQIEELNAWLGWVEHWTGCEGYCKSNVSHTKTISLPLGMSPKSCVLQEICYIPMWPVGGWRWGGDADEALFYPKCVNNSAYPP